MPRLPTATVLYHGHTLHPDGQRSVTLGIRGQRYEYFLTPSQCDTTEYLCKRGLARRALNFAKSRATRVLKLQTSAIST